MNNETVTVDRETGEIVEAPQVEGCLRCDAHRKRADTAEADLRAAETELRRQRRAVEAIKAELRQQREEEPQAQQIREVLGHWQDRCGHRTAKVPLDGKRAQCVRTALRQKHTVAELKEAIDGCALVPYVVDGQGRRAEGAKEQRRDDLELICRDETTINRFRGYAQRAAERAEEHRRRALDAPALLAKLKGVRREKEGQWMARCPAHDDRRASLCVTQDDRGVGVHCFAGCDYAQITAALGVAQDALFAPEGPPAPTSIRPQRVAAPSAVPIAPLPSQADIDAFVKRLVTSERLLARLEELRGWTLPALVALEVGFDGERLTLPVRDAMGRLVNVMKYRPGGAKPKMLPWASGHGRDLFPAPESDVVGIPATVYGDEIWLVEGEADAITGRELGLPVVAVPGANGWRDEWAPRFAGRRVVVVGDCDAPGRAAAARVARSLATDASEVRLVELDETQTDGFDLTDAAMGGARAEVLRALAAEAPVVRREEKAA